MADSRCFVQFSHPGREHIFGQRFLYSNCGQPKRPGLRQLDRGSVIAFGSGRKPDGEWRWMLDTVLVVRDFKEYNGSDARNALKDWAPSTFLDVTISPLTGDAGQSTPASCAPTPRRCAPTTPTGGVPTGDLLRLYRGATPDDPFDGMFSFFPASPARGDSGFKRPFIELPADYLNPRSAQSPKGLRRNRTPDELRGLWNRLVAQVRDAGLVLGTHAELPERRQAQPSGGAADSSSSARDSSVAASRRVYLAACGGSRRGRRRTQCGAVVAGRYGSGNSSR